jgi:hypothetical protein
MQLLHLKRFTVGQSDPSNKNEAKPCCKDLDLLLVAAVRRTNE